MPTTGGRLQLPYPALTNAANVPADIQALAVQMEAKAPALYGQGVIASRPVSTVGTPGIQGRFYFATDTNELWYDFGTGWILVQTGTTGASAVPIGATMDWPWAAASMPGSYVAPYLQAINRTTYSILAAIAAASGYPHGAGDGSTTFNLPDYRGRAGVGADNMGGSAAGRITVAISGINGQTIGQVCGAEGVTLTTGQMPAHNHGGGSHNHGGSTGNAGTHHHDVTVPATQSGGASAPAGGTGRTDAGTYTTTDAGDHSHSIPSSGTINTTDGGGGAHPNMAPSIIVNKMMRIG